MTLFRRNGSTSPAGSFVDALISLNSHCCSCQFDDGLADRSLCPPLQVVKKGGQDPVWKETLAFDLNGEDEDIRIRAFDKTLMSQDTLGTGEWDD